MGGTGRILTLSLTTTTTARLPFSLPKRLSFLKPSTTISPPHPPRVYPNIRPLSTTTTTTTATATAITATDDALEPLKHSILLERLRVRHLKDSVVVVPTSSKTKTPHSKKQSHETKVKVEAAAAESFEELGLSEEVMGALAEMGISVPTEIQSIGIPAVLGEKSVVLGSHTGSGKTLAYLLPIVQEEVVQLHRESEFKAAL